MQKIECSFCQKIYKPKRKDNCYSCASDNSCQTAKCPYCGYPAVETIKSENKRDDSVINFLKGFLKWKKDSLN